MEKCREFSSGTTLKKKADELGVKGYVKNVGDGSVLLVVKGEGSGELVEFCKSNPGYSRVENFSVEEVADEDFESFSIR